MFWRSVLTIEGLPTRLTPWVTPATLTAARTAAERRTIEPVFGSGEAELIALMVGLKPVVRQLLSQRDLEGLRARLPPGLALEVGTKLRGERHVAFLSRDVERAREAVRAEEGKNEDQALGALLGYPKCCVAAFTDVFEDSSIKRTNLILMGRAAHRTAGRPFAPRLNGLDLGMFHYISWWPCTLDCAPSRQYADGVASAVAQRHGGWLSGRTDCAPGCRHQAFVRAVDASLAAHRLVLFEDVQVSLRGRVERGELHVSEAWPTFRDRAPGAVLEPVAREAALHLTAAITAAGRVALVDGELLLAGKPALTCKDAVWAPFGGD